MGGWVGGGWLWVKKMSHCGSILQAETCQILSLAENPRWSRVWQYFISAKRLLRKQLPLKGQKKGPTGAKISLDDIVMINPGGKYNQGRFGIVKKLLSEHTAEILTKERGLESIAIANLYALVPQNLNMTPDTATNSL